MAKKAPQKKIEPKTQISKKSLKKSSTSLKKSSKKSSKPKAGGQKIS